MPYKLHVIQRMVFLSMMFGLRNNDATFPQLDTALYITHMIYNMKHTITNNNDALRNVRWFAWAEMFVETVHQYPVFHDCLIEKMNWNQYTNHVKSMCDSLRTCLCNQLDIVNIGLVMTISPAQFIGIDAYNIPAKHQLIAKLHASILNAAKREVCVIFYQLFTCDLLIYI